MAEKVPRKNPFESLPGARLSVRYSSRIGAQGFQADPVSTIGSPISSVSNHVGSQRPTLRTVVEPCPPVSIQSLLGPYQERIRRLQSPAWLIEEQRKLSGKNAGGHAGEELIKASNLLLDLCRLLEILLGEVNPEKRNEQGNKADQRNPRAAASEKNAQKLAKKIAAIWCDLYGAVENITSDCRRSAALVKRAGLEVLNLGYELDGGIFHPYGRHQKLLPSLEALSANIADAYALLLRIPAFAEKRNKIPRKALYPEVSVSRRSNGENRAGVPGDQSQTKSGLAHEAGIILNAVNELANELNNADLVNSETIGQLRLCAARLKSIQSSSSSLDKLELKFYRANFIFRQAARQLPAAHKLPGQSQASSSRNFPYRKIADNISARFDDTLHQLLKKSDPGYAGHHLIAEKKGVLPATEGNSQGPTDTPMEKNAAVAQAFSKPGSIRVETGPAPNLMRDTTWTSRPVAKVTLPRPAPTAGPECSNSDAGLKIGNVDSTNKQNAVGSGQLSVRQKRSTPEGAVRRQSVARARTMAVQWEEIQDLFKQQRLDKQDE